MAYLAPLPLQFFDAVGEPLAGGTLSFYTNDTLTLKAIYTEAGQSLQLTNPLTLDSEGRVPEAGVWCIGDYRIRVKDSTGDIIYDINDLNIVNPYDWTGLTASVSDLNSVAGALGTAGVVVASKAVVVDSSKDIATFGILTGATLRATSSVRTPQVNDANNVAAITITGTASQVNSVTLTPATTTNAPQLAASGADTNIDLKLAGKGSGAVQLSGLKYPVADGTSNQVLKTNGSGTLSFTSITPAIKQFVYSSTAGYTTSTTVIPTDDTIPQNTEGVEILTVSITPTSAGSNLLVQVNLNATSTIGYVVAGVFRDTTADAIGAASIYSANPTASGDPLIVTCAVAAGTTAATTFKVRFGPNSAGTAYVNGDTGARNFGGVMVSTITVTEY